MCSRYGVTISLHFYRTMFGIPSGTSTLYGESLHICCSICFLVIWAGAGGGTGYSKPLGIVWLASGGGKKVAANSFALSPSKSSTSNHPVLHPPFLIEFYKINCIDEFYDPENIYLPF